MSITEIALFISLFIVIYTYALYPAMIGLLAKRSAFSKLIAAPDPTVGILVVAHNEESCIARRLENILALDYDWTKLEVVVASDGSTDRTEKIASRYSDRGVSVIPFSANRGKAAVLDQVVPTLRGDIVVLMDARQTLQPDALKTLLLDFSDPAVGAVSGELVLSAPDDGESYLSGAGFYWHYEKYIRLNESRIDSVVGVTGAFYAFRRELFEQIPEDTLIEDVLIPMQIIRRGYRVLFKQGARVSDALPSEPKAEFRRKVRTLAGNFQLFHKHSWLLNPRKNRLWVQTVSHKALRLVVPAFLAAIFLLNATLLSDPLYMAMFVAQVLFYRTAAAAHIWPSLRSLSSVFSVAYTFCLLNWSTVVGFYRYIQGQQHVTWHDHRHSV